MSAKVLRTFALGRRCTPAARPARERGLAQATGRLVAATSEPSARGLRPDAPGGGASAGERRSVTAEMRGFAASISAVRAGRDCVGRSVA